MFEDTIHALWVDPLAFEPSENGAPYLPEKLAKVASEASSFLEALVQRIPGESNVAELGALVAVLRAAAIVHQSHHWQTRGPQYYGDHLLFERLYSATVAFIDQVAERAVGTGGESLVNPTVQTSLLEVIVSLWCRYPEPAPSSELAAASLNVVQCVIDCVEKARSRMSTRGALSYGTDNLLQGVADKHEEFVYLLQQRAAAPYSYDQR